MSNLADSHLTYIGSTSGPGGLFATRYDVYPRDGGAQLGWVYRTYGVWTAVPAEHPDDVKRATTRWQAATAIWPEGEVPRAA